MVASNPWHSPAASLHPLPRSLHGLFPCVSLLCLCDVMEKEAKKIWKVRGTQTHHCWLWRWKKGATSQGMQVTSTSWDRLSANSQQETARNWILLTIWMSKEMESPQKLPKRNPSENLTLVHQEPCQTSDLQKHKIINLCCFEALRLW